MKAIVLTSNIKSIDEEIRVVDDHPVPQMKPGTALVRVVKAAINPVDNLLALGIMTQAYGWVQPFPYVGGEDFSGVVHA
jgi:NADPH:quinone reductase-like Zn-dependent oxidoreductase